VTRDVGQSVRSLVKEPTLGDEPALTAEVMCPTHRWGIGLLRRSQRQCYLVVCKYANKISGTLLAVFLYV